jgi:exonuclease VII small subunit
MEFANAILGVKVDIGLQIGSVPLKGAMAVTGNPADELILLQVADLGVTDLVEFAKQMLDIPFETPPDFLRFKNFLFYLSSGTFIGKMKFPPGCNFECDALLFGTEVNVSCHIDKASTGILIKGSVTSFRIGPITIGGVKPDTPALLDVTIVNTQHVQIDGAVKIAGNHDDLVAVRLEAMLLGGPSFKIFSTLSFTDHLHFEFDASMRSSLNRVPSLDEMIELEFDIHAVWKQDILTYICEQVNEQVKNAKAKADSDLESARSQVENATKSFEEGMKTARLRLDEAEGDMKADVAKVTGAFEAARKELHAGLEKLKSAWDEANNKFQELCKRAEQKLQEARDASVAKTMELQRNLGNKSNEFTQNLDAAIQGLAQARRNMQEKFGAALEQITNAERDLQVKEGE